MLLGHGQDLDLAGGQPGGELALVLLDEHADEALEGAKAGAVNHDWALLGAVGVGVLELKALGQLEVELDGAALPGTAQAVLQVEVDLGAVEGAVAGVERVVDAHGFQGFLEALLGGGPVLVGAHRVLGTGGQLHPVGEAKLVVVGRNQVGDIGDLLGNLVAADEEVGVVLGEGAHAEQAVQGALELVAMVLAGLGQLEGQVAVGAGTALVDEAGARAVHRLDGAVLLINLGRVHVGLVVVPVAGGLPEPARQDDGGVHLLVAVGLLHLHPVLLEGVVDLHAVGQPEGEARAEVREHEEVHLLADAAMIALLSLGEQLEVPVHLFLAVEGDALDAGEHLVVGVALPVGPGDSRELEGLEGLGVEQVRAHAHVDVLTLLEEGDVGVLLQVAYVLDLVGLSALLHQGDGLGAGLLIGLELEVLLDNRAHLLLDGGQVVVGDFGLAEVDVVVEPVVGRGAVGKVSLGVEALDRLRHDVRRGVADDVELLLFRALVHVAVVVQNLHRNLSSRPERRCSAGAGCKRFSFYGLAGVCSSVEGHRRTGLTKIGRQARDFASHEG